MLTDHDSAFKILDIAPFVQEGVNEVALWCDFEQTPETYEKMVYALSRIEARVAGE